MIEYTIKPSFLDKSRRLVMTEQYFEFENRDLDGYKFTRFNKEDIVDFKHGTESIVWLDFAVGMSYSIAIKNLNDNELRINFSHYFGTKQEYESMYLEIIQHIWKYYISDLVDSFLDKFYNQDRIEIAGIQIGIHGVQLKGQNNIIGWNDISIKQSRNYFTIIDKKNPTYFSRVSYNVYGAETLWNIINTILKDEKIVSK